MAAQPDPDAVIVQTVLFATGRPADPELLQLAARAYAALRSSRERADKGRVDGR